MCRRVAADITSQWDERAGDLLGLCPRCDAVRLLDSIVGLARFGRATNVQEAGGAPFPFPPGLFVLNQLVQAGTLVLFGRCPADQVAAAGHLRPGRTCFVGAWLNTG